MQEIVTKGERMTTCSISFILLRQVKAPTLAGAEGAERGEERGAIAATGV